MVRAALREAARKREMSYEEIKSIEKGVRRHYHDDITVIVMYLDHPLSSSSSTGRFSDHSVVDCTSTPADIFSSDVNEGQC